MSFSVPYCYTPRGYQQLTAGTASPGTVLTVPSTTPHTRVRAAMIIPSSPVRWLDNGGTPSGTVGMPLAAGQTLWYDGNLAAFKVIGNAGTATLDISYYG